MDVSSSGRKTAYITSFTVKEKEKDTIIETEDVPAHSTLQHASSYVELSQNFPVITGARPTDSQSVSFGPKIEIIKHPTS